MITLAAAFLAVSAPSPLAAQGGAEIVRGQVLSPKGDPMPGVTVTVTGLQSHTERTVRTDKKGVYTILFAQGDGEYVVTAKALGYKMQRQRVVRDGDSNVLISDVAMAEVPNQLDAVVVQGKRPPIAHDKDEPSVGGDERDIDLQQGRLFSLDPSDLRSLMDGTPGLMFLPGSNGLYSALGASPDQNNMLADGMNYNGARLPADAIQSAKVATTTFDPSRGGFAGGQVSVTTRGGSNYTEGSLTSSLEDPRFAWQEAGAPSPLSRNQSWSAALSGPLKKNTAFYSLAFETRRNSTGLQSLLDMSRGLMEQSGLIRDTVAAVGSALSQWGIPLNVSSAPSQQLQTNGSYFARVDMTPTATTALTARLNGSWSQNDGQGIGATSYPTTGQSGTSSDIGAYLSGSMYLGRFLNEASLSLSSSTNQSTPYVTLPGGSVLITSLYTDGRTGLSALRFGGSAGGRQQYSNTQLSLRNETSFLTVDSRHQVKLTEEINHNINHSRSVADQFGTFSYQSLADLAANQPASYTRTLSAQDRASGAITSALSLGDVWRASPAWNFQYGLRLDLARSDVHIPYNPLVDSVFGRRTDNVPHDVGVSPRFGFSWTPSNKAPSKRPRGVENDAEMRSAFLRSRFNNRPITLSGGVGGFRGYVGPGEVASLIDQTGLPNTIRHLNCVGAATPIPQWSDFAADASAAPDQCLDGTAPVTFSTDQPTVRMYDPSFHPPLSWRGNLQLNGLFFKGWNASVSTDYSMGVNGQSQIDLNLRQTPAFTLPNEGGRPMYVTPDAIVPATGAIAPGASRIDSRFGTVTNVVSDLKNVTSQVSVQLNRDTPLLWRIPVSAWYTFSHSRTQARGLGDDPFAVQWTAGQAPTHSFNVSTSLPLWWFFLSARIQVTSGQPYTPVVGSDVNGDGRGQDPAFVFNPVTTTDTALATQLSSLLHASSSARACLRSQFGSLAGMNSCRTGWHLQPDINLGFRNIDPRISNPGKTFAWQDRLSFSLTTQNALGAALRAVGLSNTSIGRAATPPTLDPVLYYVDGFDPATQAFHYRVNQQFGETTRRPYRGHVYQAPFQVTFGARYHFGGAPKVPMVEMLHLVAPTGEPPLTVAQVRDQLLKLTASPVGTLLKMRDSLLLTEGQVAKLNEVDSTFVLRATNITAPLTDYVVEHGRKSDDAEFMKRMNQVRPKLMNEMRESFRTAVTVLTDDQRNVLPPYLQNWAQHRQ